jgi:Calcineurin-like phosphoesterase
MRTLLISDLHLGSRSRSDLLREPDVRAVLLDAAREADRIVLLGDVLELRHGPPREALAAARPFFEDLGGALRGGEIVIVAGNHDHALIEPWLARRSEQAAPSPLGLEQLLEPADASPMLARIAGWATPAWVRAAYPGLWVGPQVYAMHGHYLDCHLTVPTLERLGVGLMCRLLGRSAEQFASVADYESVTAPVFAWRDAVAREARTGAALNGVTTVRAWRALADRGGARGAASSNGVPRSLARRLRTRTLVGAFPIAVAALNRAGLGPLRADISGGELRRAGLLAMGEVTARLGLSGVDVVFGHTHRAGPLAGDDEREWLGRVAGPGLEGARLLNSGCWTYDAVFLGATPGESPYWPGSCVLVEGSDPPALRRLLGDHSHEELRPRRA